MALHGIAHGDLGHLDVFRCMHLLPNFLVKDYDVVIIRSPI